MRFRIIVRNLPCGCETLWFSGFPFPCPELALFARSFVLGSPKLKETVLEVGRDPGTLSFLQQYYSSLRLTLSLGLS